MHQFEHEIKPQGQIKQYGKQHPTVDQFIAI